MSEENTELTDVLTHADQLYDENRYHEAYELLKKFTVSNLVDKLTKYLTSFINKEPRVG